MTNTLDLARITLPDALKLKFKFLDGVDLLPTSDIYVEFDHDLSFNLEEICSIHSGLPYMNIVIENIVSQIFGKPEIKISAPKYRFIQNDKEWAVGFQGLLNKRNIELILSQHPILKYKLPKTFNFSKLTSQIPIISNLKLIDSELIISNIAYSFIDAKFGTVNISRGFNFIGNVDLASLSPNLNNLLQRNIKIEKICVAISFDPAGEVALIGYLPGNIQLFSIQDFKATFNNLLIGLDIAADLEPKLGLTGNLIVEGYDPTQKDEPKLFLSGNLSLEPESLTAFFSQQGEKPWCNPYGLAGTELRNVRFQGGGTYLPPYFDNFGFIGDLRWDKIDLEVAFLMDTNDPQKLALVLNPQQPVSLIDLWRGPVASFIVNQVGYSIDLVNKALGLLESFVDLEIEPIDSNADGKLNPLIKYVPFPTKIAGQTISEGLEINGKINVWGQTASLILDSDKTFKHISGSLKVLEIDLGFLKIKGADDESLDLALKVTPDEQYFQGDGYLEIFGDEVANVEFQITSNTANFKNFDITLGNFLSIDVDALSIDMKSVRGRGSGTISVLGNTLVDITFNLNQDSIELNEVELNLAGFLTFTIPHLIVNLAEKSATGTANIVAFNQSLGTGTLSFNTRNIAVSNTALNLGNLLNINVPSFHLDLTNKKVFGLGDIIILGKQFTNLDISLDETGLAAASNLNFGILAFNDASITLKKGTNGNINNFASITGSLQFLGSTFANIKANFNSSKLVVSGCFNFGEILVLKGMNHQRDAVITLHKGKNGSFNSVTIMGKFYLLDQELTSVSIRHNHGSWKIFGIEVISNNKIVTNPVKTKSTDPIKQ